MDVDTKPTDALVAEMKELMEKKALMESQIKLLIGTLENEKGVGMDEPLVDSEGFPRGDIDVVAVRHARHDLICLQNDHAHLMRDMEDKLYEIHSRARLEGQDSVEQLLQAPLSPRRPFMKVRSVADNSPAHRDGIKADDMVVQFGRITCVNYSQELLSSFVTTSINKPVNITVLRHGVEVVITLTPRPWEERDQNGSLAAESAPEAKIPRADDSIAMKNIYQKRHSEIPLLAAESSPEAKISRADDSIAMKNIPQKRHSDIPFETCQTKKYCLGISETSVNNDVVDMEAEETPVKSSSALTTDDIDVDADEDDNFDLKDREGCHEIIFKIPLHQLLPSPQERMMQRQIHPWLKTNTSETALVVWKPSQILKSDEDDTSMAADID